MKKLAVLGVAGVLSLAMGTSVFAADSSSGYACAMIGHHRNHSGYINSLLYAKDYCDNYVMSAGVLKSVEPCAAIYPEERVLADQVCQNAGVCVQGCAGGYVDADGNGICDNCEAAGYHGYCDNFVDADGNGVCDNLNNGYYCGNVNGSGYGNGGNYGAGNGNGGSYGTGNGGYDSGSGNGYGTGGGYGTGNGTGSGYGGGNGGHHNGGHHSGGYGRGCRR